MISSSTKAGILLNKMEKYSHFFFLISYDINGSNDYAETQKELLSEYLKADGKEHTYPILGSKHLLYRVNAAPDMNLPKSTIRIDIYGPHSVSEEYAENCRQHFIKQLQKFQEVQKPKKITFSYVVSGASHRDVAMA